MFHGGFDFGFREPPSLSGWRRNHHFFQQSMGRFHPLAGHPVGRMYYCGGNRSAKGYKEVTDSQSQEVSEARKRLMTYLGTIPYLDPENPEHTKRINKYIKGNVFPHRINVKK